MSDQGVTLVHEAITAGLELGTYTACVRAWGLAKAGATMLQWEPFAFGSNVGQDNRVSQTHQSQQSAPAGAPAGASAPNSQKSSHLRPPDPQEKDKDYISHCLGEKTPKTPSTRS